MTQTQPKPGFKYKAGTTQIFIGAALLLMAALAGSMSPEAGAFLAFALVVLTGLAFCMTGIFRRVKN